MNPDIRDPDLGAQQSPEARGSHLRIRDYQPKTTRLGTDETQSQS